MLFLQPCHDIMQCALPCIDHFWQSLKLCYWEPLPLTVPSAPPSEVKIVPDSVTSSSFLLTWCPPPVETTNGPITAYTLEYGESGSDTPPHIIPLSGVVEEYTVTGLKPHTEYHVKVAAENAAGRGPFCEQVPVQTAPDSEFWFICDIRCY